MFGRHRGPLLESSALSVKHHSETHKIALCLQEFYVDNLDNERNYLAIRVLNTIDRKKKKKKKTFSQAFHKLYQNI